MQWVKSEHSEKMIKSILTTTDYMQKTIRVSAPGKLLLLGEHAVVYGYPSMVTSVNQRMHLTATVLSSPEFQLEAPDVDIHAYKKPISELGKGEVPKGARFIERGLVNFISKYHFKNGVRIETKSEFSSLYGFGSSSASIVCILKAMSELTGAHLNNQELFDLSYKTLIDVAGKGSGFDIAAAIFGGVFYYISPGKIIEPIGAANLSLVVGYTGIKVDTVTVVNDVASLRKKNPDLVNCQFKIIEDLVNKAKSAIKEKNWSLVGSLMNSNQSALEILDVSSPKLDAMISAARSAGAFGAKLSGAGRGDCMIALVSSDKKEEVSSAITKAGGQIIPVETNVPGVMVE